MNTVSPVMLITGASRGIGAATARLAAQQGYALAINYRQNHQAAAQLHSELQQLGARVELFCADISTEAEILRLFNEIDERLGPLKVLVNNAAILAQQTDISGIDSLRLQAIFATNVFAPFICAREAVARMSTQHGGSGGAIINVSSIAARLGSAHEYIDYAASKAAIDTFTLGLAREVAEQGIRVNAVRAGLVHTEIHASGGEPERISRLQNSIPMQRGAHAAEIAEAILWLASPQASYCTASILDVAGGK